MTGRRTLAAVLAASVLAALGVTSGVGDAPASAATASASIVVAPDSAGGVRSGTDLGVTVTVTNDGTEALPTGRIALSLDKAPVASTDYLLGKIQHPDQVLLGYLADGATSAVPRLATGSTASVHVTLKADVLSSILSSASGARLLYARYRSDDGAVQTVADSSVVRVASGSHAAVGLDTIVPVLAPAGSTGVVDVSTQEALVAPNGAWGSALRAAEADPGAAIALDPEVIASVRIAGAAAPADVRTFLDRLGGLPNEFLRLPYADTDLTLAQAAGSRSDLNPSSFAGVTLATATTGPTPAPTATASPSASAADLTAWNWSDRKVAWPVPGTSGASDLTRFAAAGDQVLLSTDDLVDTSARRTAGPLARIGAAGVLVSDAAVSSLLSDASANGVAGDSALATLNGMLATAAVSGETTTLLATVGRSADTTRLDRVLRTLRGESWVRTGSLADLGSVRTAPVVRLRTSTIAASRTATARSLLAGEQRVQQLGKAVTAHPDTVTAPQRLALLGALSSAWRGQDDRWQAVASSVEQGFTHLVGLVRLAEGSESNAIGADGTLRVTVLNGLPEPVAVIVRASASNGKLQFDDASASVAVPASGQNQAKLTYRSITNGATDVSLTLSTADGTLLDRGQRQFTVSAGFDTLVAVVLLAALALLLGLGVYRNIARRRNPRQEASS
ncbi:DUF6049 family protein [Amnibacterium sp.]|uniref:DUF6049 family protein n=1 Tax=Amnibacterium sp. TaxID=1872496 RepID=UPI003F7BE32C